MFQMGMKRKTSSTALYSCIPSDIHLRETGELYLGVRNSSLSPQITGKFAITFYITFYLLWMVQRQHWSREVGLKWEIEKFGNQISRLSTATEF